MTEPSPELEQQVRLSFAQLEPERLFRKCKISEQDGSLFVRVYSHHVRFPTVMPTPYEIFRFHCDSGRLSRLSSEEEAPFLIQNYK